jgi:hypothetical protein
LWTPTTAGFCTICSTLPPPARAETEAATTSVNINGMNARFNETFHFISAEPHATFLRVGVTDYGQEVAFEALVLGRLRRGCRVLQLRSALGTRIELAYLFVHITLATEHNAWSTPRQVSASHMTPCALRCVRRILLC